MSNLVVYEAKFEEDVKKNSLAVSEYVNEEASKYVLASAADYKEAGEIVNELAAKIKELDNIERSMTAGAYQTIEAIKEKIRPFKEQAKEGLKIWKEKMQDYISAQQLQQEEVRKQLQEAVKKNDPKEVRAGLTKLEEAPKTEGIQQRKIWKWKVQNRDIVPTQFTTVDTDKVTAEMRRQLANGDTRPYIAGIEFYQDTIVAATGGR